MDLRKASEKEHKLFRVQRLSAPHRKKRYGELSLLEVLPSANKMFLLISLRLQNSFTKFRNKRPLCCEDEDNNSEDHRENSLDVPVWFAEYQNSNGKGSDGTANVPKVVERANVVSLMFEGHCNHKSNYRIPECAEQKEAPMSPVSIFFRTKKSGLFNTNDNQKPRKNTYEILKKHVVTYAMRKMASTANKIPRVCFVVGGLS